MHVLEGGSPAPHPPPAPSQTPQKIKVCARPCCAAGCFKSHARGRKGGAVAQTEKWAECSADCPQNRNWGRKCRLSGFVNERKMEEVVLLTHGFIRPVCQQVL